MEMKFMMRTDSSKVREMCIKYNFCTKMTCEEYDEMLNRIDGCRFNMNDAEDVQLYKYAVEKTAKLIYFHSSDESLSDMDARLEDIAGMIFNRCTLRWVE